MQACDIFMVVTWGWGRIVRRQAYKDIEGQWTFAGFTLIVDHAQSDPFAHPSRCRVQLSMATAGFPAVRALIHIPHSFGETFCGRSR